MTATGPANGSQELRYSFCIAGTQKSGTSSLSALLDRHPNIRRAPRKEMHYFDQEARDWSSDDYSDFTVPARPNRTQIVGDATPLYLWWPQALERIKAYNPDMKLTAVFRDPIERLFSQWGMNVNRWPKVALDWPEFLTRFAPDGLEDQIPRKANVHAYRMHSGIVRGYYGAQVQRALDLFGKEQVHWLEFRSFLRDYGRHLDEMTDFLELPRFKEHPPLPHSMRGKEAIVGTPPTGEDISDLVERYRADFEAFRQLTGLDVSDWPLQRLLDGTLDPDELAAQYAKKVTARVDAD